MHDGLEQELTTLIVETCRVTEEVPAHIPTNAPLIGPTSPFGLDSLDAVEVVVAVQKRYGIRIDSPETGRRILQSLETLADFIHQNRR
jgi:acyl carrier protein